MKRRWFGAAAVVVAACAISVFSARRIEAQYSSPVKVVNSSSAPALNSSVDDHGRVPYWSEVQAGLVTGQNCPADSSFCVVTFGPVPSGHRLVIEHVSGQLPHTGIVNEILVQLKVAAPTGILDFYSFFDVPTTGNFDVPTLAYIDAQQSVNVAAFVIGGGTIQTSFSRIILTGYLLDCTAAPCAAIAH
jgi:hypothetical protein